MTEKREQAGPGSWPGRVLRRLRSRPDSEHEMRFNGTGFAIAILIYQLARGDHDQTSLAILLAYMTLNVCVLAHILRHPGICRPRRVFSILNDFISLYWVMHLGDAATPILFPIYIWVVLGNGFRFGLRFLALATTLALASSGMLVATTPFWRSEPALSAGLLGGILLVAFSAVPLIQKLLQAKRQAEAADRDRAFLLASVGHELRQPLAAIVGSGSMLQDSGLDPAQQQVARSMVSAGERVRMLINGIPVTRREDAGAPRRHRRPPPEPETADRRPQNDPEDDR